MNIQRYDASSTNSVKTHGVKCRSQRGAIALIVTVILVVIASLSSLVVNKSAMNEQQRSGINLRNKEVYSAANGALEFGVYELMRMYNDSVDTTPDWTNTDEAAGEDAAAGETATASYLFDGVVSLTQGVGAYRAFDAADLPTITYTLLSAEGQNPAIIEITATVVGVVESHVTKTVSIRVLRADLGTPSMFSGPPLIVEGCIPPGAAIGTPDIVSDQIAVATVNGDSSDPDCLDQGNLEVTGGGVVGEQIGDADSLFDTMFGEGMTAADIQEMADLSASVYYVTESTPWGESVGSLTNPVILFFAEESECPAINGGAIIYGLVYYETPEGGCSDPGSGAGTVFGTVAFEGDLLKFNANIELVEVDFGNTGGSDSEIQVITTLPGSWHDY